MATVLVARSVGLCFVAMGEYFLFSNAKDTAQKTGLIIMADLGFLKYFWVSVCNMNDDLISISGITGLYN